MRNTASLAIVLALSAASPTPARADRCYVDSDCPTGMECNDNGGCEVPAATNGAPPSHASGTRTLIYAAILGVIIIALLVPAMQATDQANGVRKLDDAFPPLDRGRCEPGPILFRF